MDRATPSLPSYRLPLLVGSIAGLVGGLATSFVVFEIDLLPPLTWAGFFILIVLRGAVLGGAPGFLVGFACVEWMKPPFRTPAAAIAGALIGSLAVFAPVPFHLPSEINDLLMVREAQP